jgi:preprotein translocase SecE subunit
MAMSVAENAPATLERTPRGAQQQLAVGSLLGAVYVLVAVWVVLAGLPLAWSAAIHTAEGKPSFNNEYLFSTLLLMICGLAAVALGYLGYQLIRNQEIRGLRTGILFAAVMLFGSLWIAEAAGNSFEAQLDAPVGISIAVLLVLALIGGTIFLFLQPFWGRLLETVEDQGWFHATAFKASQGVRVRRGTVVGVLTLGICGIYTLVTHRTFGYEAPGLPANDWFWKVPFTGETDVLHPFVIPLIYKIHLVMPVLLAGVLLLFAWRLVNVPAFADFLIATEAEINKVSWTTRRRLIQDTIVVLVTVLLMTIFLFAVDILWVLILRYQYVGVLYYDPREVQQKQQEKNQW